MTEMDLVAIQPRSFKPRATESRHTVLDKKDVLSASFLGIHHLIIADSYIELIIGMFVVQGGDFWILAEPVTYRAPNTSLMAFRYPKPFKVSGSR